MTTPPPHRSLGGRLGIRSRMALVASRQRPTLPHTCGAGALAREEWPAVSTSERNYQQMFIRHRQAMTCRLILELRGTHSRNGHGARSTLPRKYEYRRRLPHLQKADADLFVTFCAGARRILPELARDLVLDHCLREAGVRPFPDEAARSTPARIHLHAAVVMPEHVHLLFAPLRDNDGWPYSLVNIMQCLKGATAHRINKLLRISGPV